LNPDEVKRLISEMGMIVDGSISPPQLVKKKQLGKRKKIKVKEKKEKKDGSWDISYKLHDIGLNQLFVTIEDIPIERSPFAVQVVGFIAVFTTLGTEGRIGPSTFGTHYHEKPHQHQVQLIKGYQLWTIPITGLYRIEAFGAASYPQTDDLKTPHRYFGKGAMMSGDFKLKQGDTLLILIGQQPKQSEFNGGGGGTFITLGNDRKTSTPLLIAGGGASFRCGFEPTTGGGSLSLLDAVTTQDGVSGYKTGGRDGQGCLETGIFVGGGGGAGFVGDGSLSATSFRNGGLGGTYTFYTPQEGGFGGGGAGGWGGSGGGGGYSGGSCGNNHLYPCGGGGGSFNCGSNQRNESGANNSGGRAVITYIVQ